MEGNSYVPQLAIITRIRPETELISTFELQFVDEAVGRAFRHRVGQFVELTVFGVGEAPISVSSQPGNDGRLELTVVSVGEVTQALHEKVEGDLVGIRGPYGNGFPMDDLVGRDLLFLSGGIGLAPLRPVVLHVLANRDDFGRVSMLCGAREQTRCFTPDIECWTHMPDTIVKVLTVPSVRQFLDRLAAGPVELAGVTAHIAVAEATALVCGPSVMERFVVDRLLKVGFPPDRIILTLERRMECGVGKCGHCNVGGVHVCTDGPVFTLAELMELTEGI